jgi:hypothetical protein
MKIGIQILLLIFALLSCSKPIAADYVYINGHIITVDEALPKASSVAVKDGKILAVSEADLSQTYTGEIVDLNGKTMIPGFIEGHGHFMGMGRSLQNLNFLDAKNFDDILEALREKVKTAKEGEWIIGRGWHQEKWDKAPQDAVDGLPSHKELSEIAPNNPVIFRHASGHSLIANEKAMELAGITHSSKNPFGGEIIRNKSGKIQGVFLENAMGPFRRAFGKYLAERSAEEVAKSEKDAAILAASHSLANGVTSFQDAGAAFSELDLYKELAEANELNIRIWAMILSAQSGYDSKHEAYKKEVVTDHYTLGGIKLSIDGALGSHGAWLLEPYTDLKTTSGLNLVPVERFKAIAEYAYANNLQMGTHAIGDKANRVVLDVYESILQDGDDRRWRVEHAQHLNPSDIPRFAKLGVTAAMQGVHCTSDGPFVPKRLGEKRSEEGAYVWKTLLESGTLITNGTDVPVEALSPIASYYSTVSRMMKNGERFYPEQRLSRLEALKTYTINSAKAVFEENIKGSISVGKFADFAVLSQDITSVDEDRILETTVEMTVVGGKRYEF